MYATDYFETMILNLTRGVSATAPTSVYLALYLNNPTDSGEGTEVSYSGYERLPVAFSTPAPIGSGMGIQNTADLTFAQASTAVGNATYVGVLDSLAGGNMYLYGQLVEPLSIQPGIAPVVRAGGVKWISSGKLSNAYKTKILNILRGTDCPGFVPYLALLNGSPESGGAEFTGNGYQRTAMEFSTPASQANGNMMIQNTSRIDSPIATGTWGQMTHIAVYDAQSDGSPFLIDQASTQIMMNNGKMVTYAPGAFNISIN